MLLRKGCSYGYIRRGTRQPLQWLYMSFFPAFLPPFGRAELLETVLADRLLPFFVGRHLRAEMDLKGLPRFDTGPLPPLLPLPLLPTLLLLLLLRPLRLQSGAVGPRPGNPPGLPANLPRPRTLPAPQLPVDFVRLPLICSEPLLDEAARCRASLDAR